MDRQAARFTIRKNGIEYHVYINDQSQELNSSFVICLYEITWTDKDGVEHVTRGQRKLGIPDFSKIPVNLPSGFYFANKILEKETNK